jgi:hypothetical protein
MSRVLPILKQLSLQVQGLLVLRGGAGSGNFGHSGRPGQVGGSGGGVSYSGENYRTESDLGKINSVSMLHMTKKENEDKIKENGFRFSSNSMYGEGVYFSSQAAYGSGSDNVTLSVKLKSHSQLVLENGTDIDRISKDLGVPASWMGSKWRTSMLEKGIGSVRFPVDDEIYTVVLDPSLIEIE